MVPALVMRAMYPKYTTISASAGSVRYFTWVTKFDPGGASANTSNQPNFTPMTYCSVTPDTNSGIDELATPSVTMLRSVNVLRRRAASIPAMIATGTVRTRP